MLRVARQTALLCALAAAAVIQCCDAARARPAAKVKPLTSKGPHRSPIRPMKPRVALQKPAAGRKPAASQKRVLAAAQPATVEQVTIRACGTPTLNQTMRVAVQSVLQPRIEQLAQSRAAPVTVRVYFHFVQVGSDPSSGFVSDQQIAAQLSVLNTAFGGAQLTFVLAGVQRITNRPEWWNLDTTSRAYTAFKTVTRQGTFADLNIFVTSLRGGLLGVTTPPFQQAGSADGVMIHPFTFPGGSYNTFGLGYTAVHETGHWLSLLHPFEGGCSEPNDGCSDTAETAQPIMTCPSVAPDTCPHKPRNQPTGDPIHNFMSYTPDACMASFTSQQLLRANSAWTSYRARYQLNPLPLPGGPVLRLAPSPPPPPMNKKPVAPVAKPKPAPVPAKPAPAAARTAPAKVTKPPVKTAAPVAKPNTAPVPAKPVPAAAKAVPKKVTKPPVKTSAG